MSRNTEQEAASDLDAVLRRQHLAPKQHKSGLRRSREGPGEAGRC